MRFSAVSSLARSGRQPRREPAVVSPLAGCGAGGAGRGGGRGDAGRRGPAGVPAPPARAPNEWLGPGPATRWRVAAAAIVSRRALPASCAPIVFWAPFTLFRRTGAGGEGGSNPRLRVPLRPASSSLAAGGGGGGVEQTIPPGWWPSPRTFEDPPYFSLRIVCDSEDI